MKCMRCRKALEEKDTIYKNGVSPCEECYMKEAKVQSCNPWAVRSAKTFGKIRALSLAKGKRFFTNC